MALALTTITDSIAALTVTGLTMYDIDQIPDAATRNVPCLYPEPVDFVTDFAVERASFAGSKWNVEYDLTYTLLYAPIGSGRGMEYFSPTVALAFTVVDAILALYAVTGAVLIKFVSLSTPGPMADPAGNMYFGCQMQFRLTEFVN